MSHCVGDWQSAAEWKNSGGGRRLHELIDDYLHKEELLHSNRSFSGTTVFLEGCTKASSTLRAFYSLNLFAVGVHWANVTQRFDCYWQISEFMQVKT